jgi:hypothetical protein
MEMVMIHGAHGHLVGQFFLTFNQQAFGPHGEPAETGPVRHRTVRSHSRESRR